MPHPAPRTSASLICSSAPRKHGSTTAHTLAAALLTTLAGLHCTAVSEHHRPDPTPALAASQDAVATGHATADETTTTFVARRAAERANAVQHWVDQLERTTQALERAVPRTRDPQPTHRHDADDAIARAHEATRTLGRAPWRPDDPDLDAALVHAADTLRAAEDLLEYAFDGQAVPADRAWEAVVAHFNAWRSALQRSLTHGPLRSLLDPTPQTVRRPD